MVEEGQGRVRLEVVQAPRRGHNCTECQGRTKARGSVIVLIHEEKIDGKIQKWISYFCSWKCYNDYECRVKYGASAALEV